MNIPITRVARGCATDVIMRRANPSRGGGREIADAGATAGSVAGAGAGAGAGARGSSSTKINSQAYLRQTSTDLGPFILGRIDQNFFSEGATRARAMYLLDCSSTSSYMDQKSLLTTRRACFRTSYCSFKISLSSKIRIRAQPVFTPLGKWRLKRQADPA